MSQKSVTGRYRLLAFDEQVGGILLYDLQRQEPLVVEREGYSQDMDQFLRELDIGNVVEAEVHGDPTDDSLWRFRQVEFLRGETHHLFEDVADVPAPHEKYWENRDPDSEAPTGTFSVEGREILEVQLHPDEYEGEPILDLFRDGRYPLDSWYGSVEGVDNRGASGLTEFDAGAEHIIVADIRDAEYIVMFLFPHDDEQTREKVREFLTIIGEQSPTPTPV